MGISWLIVGISWLIYGNMGNTSIVMGVPQNGWIIVENPIKDGDFPVRYVSLPEGMRGVHMGYEWEIYMGYNLLYGYLSGMFIWDISMG